jgi:ribosomal protein S18 acetylase RimI-like enzyme
MEVRPPRSLAEFRAAYAVNRDAWRDAYDHILPDDVLGDLTVPGGADLRERYETATGDGRTYLVAVDSGSASDGVAVEPPENGDSAASDDGEEPMEASDDRVVLGFASFVWDSADTKAFVPDGAAGLRAIYVHPDAQGNGVGSDLLSAGVARVPDDCTAAVLEVFAANGDARGFYEARGFEWVGESFFEVAGESYPTAVYERLLE